LLLKKLHRIFVSSIEKIRRHLPSFSINNRQLTIYNMHSAC